MSVVVGVAPAGGAVDGVHLAGRIAASLGEELVVCTVVPAPWEPTALPHGIDASFRGALADAAADALDEAVGILPPEVVPTAVEVNGRSVPRTLLAQVATRGADLLVLGSATGSLLGQVSLGNISDRLMHSADIAVALSPRGFWSAPGDRIERLVVAVGPSEQSPEAFSCAFDWAERFGVPIALVTFGVHRPSGNPRGGGRQADTAIMRSWSAHVASLHDAVEDWAHDRGLVVTERSILPASTWRAALERFHWLEGDLLVLGSSSAGPLTRVFLGSTGSRLMRNSPAPVLVLPRP